MSTGGSGEDSVSLSMRAEHVGVVEEDVHWSLGMKTDVCDGNCPFGAKDDETLLLGDRLYSVYCLSGMLYSNT